jgi:hypothetical protein
MDQHEAYAALPIGVEWSSSFGYPGEDGFCEIWRNPHTGTRFEVRRVSREQWEVKELKPS